MIIFQNYVSLPQGSSDMLHDLTDLIDLTIATDSPDTWFQVNMEISRDMLCSSGFTPHGMRILGSYQHTSASWFYQHNSLQIY